MSLDKIIPIILSRDLKWNVNRKCSLHLKLFPRLFSNESDISHRSTSRENRRERIAPNLDVQGFRDSVYLEDKDCECTLPNSLRSKSTDFSPTSDGVIFQFLHIFFDAFILQRSLETPPELTTHPKTFFFKTLNILHDWLPLAVIKSNQRLSENSVPSRAVSKY